MYPSAFLIGQPNFCVTQEEIGTQTFALNSIFASQLLVDFPLFSLNFFGAAKESEFRLRKRDKKALFKANFDLEGKLIIILWGSK